MNPMEKNRRFYEMQVAPLIHDQFGEYENRIAVGIVGEGSDCFGYDDVLSRDHDFGTGVCLWLQEEDMSKFGYALSVMYNELVDRFADEYFTDRIRQRRGVMTIRKFYSNILQVNCDTDRCVIPRETWLALDHHCLATAVNGVVFRDDLGKFTAFRQLLLAYYPDSIWRIRIAEELHRFSAALQVNYARCMTRGDVVAAELCRGQGLSAAMELFFLLMRQYPPYYKWTFKALCELDTDGDFAEWIEKLAETSSNKKAWEDTTYHPNRLNLKDEVVSVTESIAYRIAGLLRERGLAKAYDPYLEIYVNEVMGDQRG